MKGLFSLLLSSSLVGNVLAKTAGCGKAALTSGSKSITVGSEARQYILKMPDNYNPNFAYKLIFGLHWRDGDMNAVAQGTTTNGGPQWAYYGLPKYANNTAIFVSPNGQNKGWANPGGKDMTFITTLMQYLEDNLCIDEHQRYSTGWSWGGAMSYSIACSLGTKFRAVAVLSGGLLSGCSGAKDAIPYLGIHGIRDSVVNIGMGRSARDIFVKNNGCSATSPTEPSRGGLNHIKTEYKGCKEGFPVTWIAFDGDHLNAPADGDTSPNGQKTWAPEETWKFFSQFFNSNKTNLA